MHETIGVLVKIRKKAKSYPHDKSQGPHSTPDTIK